MRSAGYHEKMIGRTYFGGEQVTQLNLVLYNTIKWPYQPTHSPSFNYKKQTHCSWNIYYAVHLIYFLIIKKCNTYIAIADCPHIS